ncbi:hypothetical protein PINS_up005042 [Pythium insidiosum]|nr:hypothetical protein PINS_up005042 [Pythium insidiosum]
MGGIVGRIRELMQPLMAKLPALLLAKSGKASSSSNQNSRAPSAAASRCSSRPSSSVSTSSSTRESSKREKKPKRTGSSSSNQETHNDSGRDVADDVSRLSRESNGRRTKPVPKKKAKVRASSGPTSALAEVEKRKRMFATWLQAHREGDAAAAEQQEVATRLPPLYPDNHTQRGNGTTPTQAPIADDSNHTLPPIDAHPTNAVTTPDAAIESDDSFDEDEVNDLLNWTDNLLSPDSLDTSLDALNIDGG